MTPGHTDERPPVPRVVTGLTGQRFGDRSSLSHPLFKVLLAQPLQWITKLRKIRRNQRLPLADKLFLRQRALIETRNDPLNNMSPLEQPRHRSGLNAMVPLLAGWVA